MTQDQMTETQAYYAGRSAFVLDAPGGNPFTTPALADAWQRGVNHERSEKQAGSDALRNLVATSERVEAERKAMLLALDALQSAITLRRAVVEQSRVGFPGLAVKFIEAATLLTSATAYRTSLVGSVDDAHGLVDDLEFIARKIADPLIAEVGANAKAAFSIKAENFTDECWKALEGNATFEITSAAEAARAESGFHHDRRRNPGLDRDARAFGEDA